jgi:hypothetical protein
MANNPPPLPCIHNSPTKKIELRDRLYKRLFQRTLERFAEMLEAIIEQNNQLTGYEWKGFTYRGTYYGAEVEAYVKTLDRKIRLGVAYQLRNQRLDASLYPAMEKLLEERHEAEQVDGTMAISTIGSVLNASESFEDYKCLLPNNLHDLLDEEAVRCECTPQPLAADALQVFQTTQQTYLNRLKRRRVIDLLLY